MTFVIFGGAGFIGTNLAARVAASGQRVRVVDNMSRPTARLNARWLDDSFQSCVDVRVGDVRDWRFVRDCLKDAHAVVHLAAQVAVTTSLDDPRHDFAVNVGGTFNVLEALRGRHVPLVFASTNKVYGALRGVELMETPTRWMPSAGQLSSNGVGEDTPLQFASPYGCSKGAADQYVIDHADCYGMPNVVFRMSCIYGPHQFGTEDQGWVSHFLIAALAGEPITVYGDGKQVRDILFVDDLLDAYLLALDKAESLRGRAFNMGGSPEHTLSLIELLAHIERLTGKPPRLQSDAPRHGDQRYYVSNIGAFREATGWMPKTTVTEGIGTLARWLKQHHPKVKRSREWSKQSPAA